MTLHAQPFAETATNFFYTAHEKNFWQNILIPDAGYIPLFERLIAVFLVQVLHLQKQFMLTAQMLTITCIAIFSSVITLRIFRKIFPSDVIRFLLALSVGLIPDYELNTFINFLYYGFIPAFLLLFIDKEKIKSKYLILFFVLLLLLIISKPHFFLFLPVYLFVGVFAFKKKLYKTGWFYMGGVIAFILQILSILLHPFMFGGAAHRSLLKKSAEIIYAVLVMYKHAFFNDYLFNNIPGFLIFLSLLAIIIFVFVRNQLKSNDQFPLYFFIVCNYFAMFSIALTMMTIAAIFPPSMPFFGLPNDRHFFFANVAVLFAGTMVLQTFIKKRWVLLLTVFLLLFTSNAFLYPFDKQQQKKIVFNTYDHYPVSQMSYAQWEYTSLVLKNTDYCIPVNPFPWLLHKNCDYLNSPHEIQSHNEKVEEYDLMDNHSASAFWHIRAIVLVNIPNHNRFHKLKILAYDKNNKLVGEAHQLTPNTEYNYLYFYFPTKVAGVRRLAFLTNNKPIALIPEFIFLGTQSL